MKKCKCGCGEEIIVRPHHKYRGLPDYLWGHNKASYKPLRYIINEDTSCWEWQLFKMKGYGQMNVKQKDGTFKRTLAHRYYYEKYKGKIPDGMQLDHLCRNHMCVNPAHLEVVSNRINTQRGDMAKLNEIKVREIRELYATGEYSHRKLGSVYHVTHTVIGHVLRGETWNNVV